MKYITTVSGKEYEVELLPDGQVSVDGQVYNVDYETVTGQQVISLIVDHQSYETHIYQDEDDWHILMRGSLYTVQVEDEREKRLRDAAGIGGDASGEFALRAPMPGLVVKVPINIGDAIEAGDVLVILESMKMQNELKAPQAGIVLEVNVNEGDSVEQKEPMVRLGPPAED